MSNISEQRNLIVGLDLCNDFTQMSCYNYKSFEPESISMNPNQEKYFIPTVLGIKSDTKDWTYGEEAINYHNLQKGLLIVDLLLKVEKDLDTEIFGVQFKAVTLLEKYLRKCLQLLKVYHPTNSIKKVVITLKNNNEIMTSAVYQALDNLGIGKDRAYVQNHLQSYQYFALCQAKELWMNDIGLFIFDESGLFYYQITINRKSRPYIVGMIEKDFSGTLSFDMIEELKGNENLEYIFQTIAKSVLFKQVVPTIYITGKGFDGSWSDNVLKELCVGRRVFKGQNLYTKGACYAAKELTGEDSKFADYLFLSSDMIMSTFFIQGYYDAKTSDVILVKAGSPWYQIDENVDIILDDEQSITIYVQDVIKRETVPFSIELTGLPKRPNKLTRIGIRIQFSNKETAIVTAKDKGFGELHMSTDRIWEKEIKIS